MSTALPDYVMAELEAVEAKREARSITVNVNGGFATADDIAQTTVNALRQYNQSHGPIPVEIG
jgi:succinyl-CoA synthetase beta subunit